ncbi:MAG: hypothetical protein AAB390_03465 [Patescibacteria group bacterium]
MPTKSLSPQALGVINDYAHLPFAGRDISVPYFNNQRVGVRVGLRALIGKGSAEDIVEEAKIISLRDKINLDRLTGEQLKKFLVDNNLGLDCSALAYYVLNAELLSQNKKPLKNLIKFPYAKNPIRKLLMKLRPVENVAVNTLAHENNSRVIELKDIRPGDMIVMLGAGLQHHLNHILLIHRIDYNEQNEPTKIYYTHSFKWPSDGKYGTGIKQGTIEITAVGMNLSEQEWKESGRTGNDNETFRHAKLSNTLCIRRLNCL